VVPASFYDFFNGCASVAGALIGLLFVALSVSQEKLTGPDASLEHQLRAAAAFSALVNTLVIALFGLLPGASLGEVGLVLAIAGLGTTAGSLALLYREQGRRISRGDVRLLAILIVLYALQLANAVQLEGTLRDVSGVARQGGLAIVFFVFGITRSWQLVGARTVSLASTVAAVIQRPAAGPGPSPAPSPSPAPLDTAPPGDRPGEPA
jgi:hypothetical protein